VLSTPLGRIILVRHGETDANRLRRFAESGEIPLTELGFQQARNLAIEIAQNFKPVALLSSRYLRARQTSSVLGKALELLPILLDGIHERDFGVLKNQPYHRMGEMMRQDPAFDSAQPWLWVPPDGESLEQVRVRAVAALDTLCSQSPFDLVVVSHGAVIQSLAAHLTGEWSESHLPPNCGMKIVEHDGQLSPGHAWLQESLVTSESPSE
jgi:broad specificity phosphatase PhoE